MPQFSTLQGQLLSLLTTDIDTDTVQSIPEPAWQTLLDLAGTHRIQGYLYFNLKRNGVLEWLPSEVGQKLLELFQKETMRNLRFQGELRRIADMLSSQNTPVLVLKGLHLIAAIYPHIGTRHFKDIDFLVPVSKARQTYDLIKAMGYHVFRADEPGDELFSFIRNHHLPQMFNPQRKIFLEIHGRITRPQRVRLDTDTMCQRAVDIDIPGHHYKVLCPEDLLLHLCVHIAYADNFYMGIRHYLDIYLLLEKHQTSLDWDVVVHEAKKSQSLTGVYLVLKITSLLFTIDIPRQARFKPASDENIERLLHTAFEFLWAYDKSSSYYDQYKKLPRDMTQQPVPKKLNKVFLNKAALRELYHLPENASWGKGAAIRLMDLTKNVYIRLKKRKLQKRVDHFQMMLRDSK